MAKVNLQTWTRVTRLDLSHLTVGIGNAALEVLHQWPSTGEGRDVKAKSEAISRMLEFTHDKGDVLAQIEHLEHVISLFLQINDNKFFKSHIAKKKYVLRSGKKLSLGQAISETVDKFSEFVVSNRPKRNPRVDVSGANNSLSTGEFDTDDIQILEKITPKQKNAPLQFEFVGGFLQIKGQGAQTSTQANKTNVSYAQIALSDDVKSLLKVLNDSNCDPRLLSAVEEISSVISSNADIIKLGFLSFTCDSLFVRFSNELSEIANARFLALSTGLGLYVSQFPQWREFVENAAEINFQDQDLESVSNIGTKLLPSLEEARDLVDPEVPKSIKLVMEAINNPKLSRKRAFYGAVRTLENLFATIFSEFAKIASSVAEGARVGVKHTTNILVASTLLLVAASSAAQLSPIAERALKAKWMKQAAELVEKAIK
jgi:hypothetical protein